MNVDIEQMKMNQMSFLKTKLIPSHLTTTITREIDFVRNRCRGQGHLQLNINGIVYRRR
ncbi:hypothetical protein AGABI1DRAFT_85798, partial [Agaricus bisporus var. burnettii JB137-S8]